MKVRTTTILAFLTILATLPVAGFGQTDALGNIDTLYADVSRVDTTNWKVTFSYTNDEDVVGFAIPFKINAGLNRIVADSVTYSDRVANWAHKSFRADTSIQCVTLGLIANLGMGQRRKCLPGDGQLATVYISSLEGKPFDNLQVDTTTTNPNNSLMAVADLIQGTPPDTVRIKPGEMSIYPAFVLRKPTEAKK